MKDSDLFEVPDIAPRPACSVDGTWYALPDAGALIHVDGEPWCRLSFAQSPYGPYPASRSCRIDSMITCESEHT
ncbi:hypothetical protein SAMN05192544_104060 [Paraburkholderia hospita]|nr:hypothetical protein SAMN05192544_104060 [Paraburkholderia hospita]